MPVEKTPAIAVREPEPPPPGAVIDPGTTSPATPTAQPEPLYKKWWLWTSVGGIALVGAGAGVGVALGTRRDAAMPEGLTAGTFKPTWP